MRPLEWHFRAAVGAYAFHNGRPRIPSIMSLFPGIQFYDYTKVPGRFERPRNYYLNYSWNEKVLRPRFAGDTVEYRAKEYMRRGVNPVVVFDKFPRSFLSRPVIDGMETDLRFLDDSMVVVGLLPLMFAQNDETGFVVRTGVRERGIVNPHRGPGRAVRGHGDGIALDGPEVHEELQEVNEYLREKCLTLEYGRTSK